MKTVFTFIMNFSAIGAVMPVIWHFVNKYLWHDWEFAGFLAFLIMIDTALGMWYAFREDKFSSAAMGRLPVKVTLTVTGLLIIHGLAKWTERSAEGNPLALIVPYLDSVCYSFFVLREIISIYEKSVKLGYPIFPAWLMTKLKKYQKNGQN